MKSRGFFCVLGMLFLLSACSGEKKAVESSVETAAPQIKIEASTAAAESSTAESGTQPVAEGERRRENGQVQSFLSGKMVPEALGDRRPLAVMISNDKEARPQYGLSKADIVYEAPAEGEMNRYLALLEDYDELPRIGSVRSTRTYYIYFAREWDAILSHFGQSTFALPYLQNVDNINGVDTGHSYFYRSSDKRKPHNAYTGGELVNKAIEDFGYRKYYEEDYKGNFRFADEENLLEQGMEAVKVIPGYNYQQPYFVYNEQDKLYYRFQYGEAQISNDVQIAVDNIILNYTRMTYYATTAYRDVALHEENRGYYISRGRAIPITILKKSEFGTTHYYDAEGEEIHINPGKTWICIMDKKNENKTEILDAKGNRSNTPQEE